MTDQTDPVLDALRQRALDDPDVPAGIRRALDAGAQLERIHLDGRGRWSHEGEPFENRRLIDLFHRSVTRTPSGLWLLSIPPYSYPITVEDTGWFVVRVTANDGVLRGELAGGEEVVLNPDALFTDGGERVLADLADGRRARLIDRAWRWVESGLTEQGGRWAVVLADGRHCVLRELTAGWGVDPQCET